ncbi:hypothetical protein ACKVMT_11005 [Halobacteriales archaeon Cl-PHB]
MSPNPAADDGDLPESGRAALLRALEVRRHAFRALAVGLAAGVGVPLLFVVVLAGGDPSQPWPYYAGLAFVVFVTVTMLAVGILVGRQVLAMAVQPASVVRRTATGGVVAGLLWLATAGALVAGLSYRWAATLLVPAALLTPFGVWAVHTRFKRTTALRPFGALAAWAALVGLLVVADLAALDMAALLPAVGAGVDASRERLFRAGLVLLVAGQVGQALLVLAGSQRATLALGLGVPPLAGLASYVALGPGRPGLAALTLGVGLAWLATCWALRGVAADEVPAADLTPSPAGR